MVAFDDLLQHHCVDGLHFQHISFFSPSLNFHLYLFFFFIMPGRTLRCLSPETASPKGLSSPMSVVGKLCRGD